MNKPHLRRDSFYPEGYVCTSRELNPEGYFFKYHSIIASGDTIAQAYYNWRQKCLRSQSNKGT